MNLENDHKYDIKFIDRSHAYGKGLSRLTSNQMLWSKTVCFNKLYREDAANFPNEADYSTETWSE